MRARGRRLGGGIQRFRRRRERGPACFSRVDAAGWLWPPPRMTRANARGGGVFAWPHRRRATGHCPAPLPWLLAYKGGSAAVRLRPPPFPQCHAPRHCCITRESLHQRCITCIKPSSPASSSLHHLHHQACITCIKKPACITCIKPASPASSRHHLHQTFITCITRASTASRVHKLHHACITPRHQCPKRLTIFTRTTRTTREKWQ